MKPDTGNWAVLTHDTQHGFVLSISWSADGSRIFYDRQTDVRHGIYSVTSLGGDEHLVLTDAGVPEALPDGSLLVFRNNAKGNQLFRFTPESGALEPFPVQAPSRNKYSQVRAFPDGRKAVILGQRIVNGKAARNSKNCSSTLLQRAFGPPATSPLGGS